MPLARESVISASPESYVKQQTRYSQSIEDFRRQLTVASESRKISVLDTLVTVCARKRPLIPVELEKDYTDGITAHGREVVVHRRIPHLDKLEIEHARFNLDMVFDEKCEESKVYSNVLQPLVHFAGAGVWQKPHVGLLLLYGQTSSGKTYTATSLHRALAEEICAPGRPPFRIAYFEIRGGHVWDLFAGGRHGRRCMMRETPDEVNIAGLKEHDVQDASHMIQLINSGSQLRSTSKTAQNAASSRSHALLRITWTGSGKQASSSFSSRLWIVDLAGAEKAADSLSDSRERRLEGADINQSLLALKECVRAMRSNPGGRIPFRASRLTLVLKDAFHRRPNVPSDQRVVMFCCLAPCAHQTEASVDTLRFATMMREAPGRGTASAQTLPMDGDEEVSELPHEEANESRPSGRSTRHRASSLADVDFVLAAASTTEPVAESSTLIAPAIVTTTEDVEIPMVTKTSLNLPNDQRTARHSRLVSELFLTENELLCSLQDAVSACEKRVSKMRQLAEQATDSVDLSDMCWKVVDAMAEQSSEAAALQGRALTLLRTIQREEGERPRIEQVSQAPPPPTKEMVFIDKCRAGQIDARSPRNRASSPGPKSPLVSPRALPAGKVIPVSRAGAVLGSPVFSMEQRISVTSTSPSRNQVIRPYGAPSSQTVGSLTVPSGPPRSNVISNEQRRFR